MKRVELLAPAKDKNTAIAAINSGCDAIYIGASNFGARKKVPNSLEDIKEIVDYAHKFYVKVHVTINTILTDAELDEACRLIQKLYNIGVDAIIVQDMGIIKRAIDGKLPPIVLHASTQCDNRTLEKVKFFNEIGVSRVILARELSLKQIQKICQYFPFSGEGGRSAGEGLIEIETFIHGALCVSYSGQCYFSHYIGGRSANRGECAQACRKKYTLVDDSGNVIAKDKYLLSLKDFNASKHLKELIDAGVKSFKIEGRLKDENYVKNVAAYYRKELDKFAQKTSSGKVFLDFEPDVKKSFNRDFTDYFLDGRKICFNFETPKSIGEKLGRITHVGKDYFELDADVAKQDGLYFNGYGCLVNKVEGNKIYPNKMEGISVGLEVYRNFDSRFEKQLENSRVKRQIGVKFICSDGILNAEDEDGNSVKITLPAGEKTKKPEKMKETFINQLKKTGESDFYVEDIVVNGKLAFMPVSKINEFRRNILEDLMKERLKNYPREFQKPLKYAEYPLKKLDYRANIHNKEAKSFYENCGCEVCEMSAESGSFPTELMRTKHCLKYAFYICKYRKKLFIIDEKGKRYPLKFDCTNCEMVILAE